MLSIFWEVIQVIEQVVVPYPPTSTNAIRVEEPKPGYIPVGADVQEEFVVAIVADVGVGKKVSVTVDLLQEFVPLITFGYLWRKR